MNSRRARQVWIVVCSIAGLLLAALWLRSYAWVDTIDVNRARTRLTIASGRGEVGVEIRPNGVPLRGPAPAFQYERIKPDFKEPLPQPSLLGFALIRDSTGTGCLMPYWALALGVTGAALFPRLTWRFSLRALLFFASLIAALLGVMRMVA